MKEQKDLLLCKINRRLIDLKTPPLVEPPHMGHFDEGFRPPKKRYHFSNSFVNHYQQVSESINNH